MRKLRIFEHMSLDGVIQNTTDDDDFPYNDWTVAYRSAPGRDMLLAMQGESFDLLLGRRVYDAWSGFWPKASSSPMSDRINAAKKYVVTHRPESLAWGPFEGLPTPSDTGRTAGTPGLEPDLIEAVRRIKAQDGPDLIVWGSSTLTSTLLEHGLVDELVLCVYPVLLGKGKRLFAEGTPACTFSLESTKTTPTGVLVNAYKVARPLRTS
jgi:dihydrofolate reductase